MVFGLRLGLKVCLDQGHRSSGNEIMYCTIRLGPKVQWAWDHTSYNSPSLIRVQLLGTNP